MTPTQKAIQERATAEEALNALKTVRQCGGCEAAERELSRRVLATAGWALSATETEIEAHRAAGHDLEADFSEGAAAVLRKRKAEFAEFADFPR